eukprot:239771-Prorocentrum_lima.AAC.1
MKRTAVSSRSSGSVGAHICVLPTWSCRPIHASLPSMVSANLFMPWPFSVMVMSSMYALIRQGTEGISDADCEQCRAQWASLH